MDYTIVAKHGEVVDQEIMELLNSVVSICSNAIDVENIIGTQMPVNYGVVGEFYFESEQLAFNSNPDYKKLLEVNYLY